MLDFMRANPGQWLVKLPLWQFVLAIPDTLAYIARKPFPIRSIRNAGEQEARSLAYTPQHIANYFLDRAAIEGRGMDPLKLLKLVYIAYGWVLALTGKRLFLEPIQAWKHGPVIPSIYHEFKHYRSQPICEPSGAFDLENGTWEIPKIPNSDSTTNMILEKVWAAYSRYSGWALRNKTHEAGTPWTETYDGSMDKVIPDALIMPHFHKKIREIVDAARAA